MAREQFYDVVFNDAGVLVNGASILVKTVNADNTQGGDATIYSSESGASKANPFLTGADGYWEFWVDNNARYNVLISGTGFSTRSRRISPSYFPPRPQSVDHNTLALNVMPLGTVLDWWRPTSATAIPTGWVECDGRTLTTTQHDFATGTSITVPDLRGKVAVGASSAKADGTASSPGNTAAEAPGIRGTGGDNTVRGGHSHIINDHTHVAPSHTHTYRLQSGVISNYLYHLFPTDVGGFFTGTSQGNLYQNPHGPITPPTLVEHYSASTDAGGAAATGGASDRGTSSYGGLDPRPLHVGLLKIIKVKNVM